jgi:hypothetical protein
MKTPDSTQQIRHSLDTLHELKQDMKVKGLIADEAKKRYQEYEHAVFQEMTAAGMTGFKSETAGYSAKSTIYANVQDSEAFEAWCAENGLTEDFLKSAPEKARLNELVRERLDNGEELPPGVGWYPRNYISITENK